MSNITQIGGENFEADVIGSELPVVVALYSNSCQACCELEPMLQRLALEFSGRTKFVRINAASEPALAEEFDVETYSCLMLVDEKGRNEGQYWGARQESEIRLHLQKWLAVREAATDE